MADVSGSVGPLSFSRAVRMNLWCPAGIASWDSRQRVGLHFGSVQVSWARFGKQFGETIAWYSMGKRRKAP